MNADTQKLLLAVVSAFVVGGGSATGLWVSRGEADCKAALAGSEVKAALVSDALAKCQAVMDTLAPPKTPPLGVLGGCAVAEAQDEPPAALVCPPCPCLDAATQAAIDAARQAIEAAKK